MAVVGIADGWTDGGDAAAALETLDAAWAVAQEVEKPGLGDARFEILAGLAAAGRCDDATTKARAMQVPFWGDGALASAARGCAKAEEIDKALALAASTKVPLWRANAYQEIALARMADDDVVGALDAVRRIPSERGRVKALAAVGAAHLEADGQPSNSLAASLDAYFEE